MKYAMNITTNVPSEIKEEWLQSMNGIYLPEFLSTQLILRHHLYRILSLEEVEGEIYTLQLIFEEKKNLQAFYELYEKEFNKRLAKQWGNTCLSYLSRMEVIH